MQADLEDAAGARILLRFFLFPVCILDVGKGLSSTPLREKFKFFRKALDFCFSSAYICMVL
jgi:hypothetical protein